MLPIEYFTYQDNEYYYRYAFFKNSNKELYVDIILNGWAWSFPIKNNQVDVTDNLVKVTDKFKEHINKMVKLRAFL